MSTPVFRAETGEFVTRKTNVVPRISQQDLPRTTVDCVCVFQQFEILPEKSLGLPLVLTDGIKKFGDKVNGGYCFRRRGCPSNMDRYCSIRPILLHQSKKKFEDSFAIFYDICREVPHRSIAQGLGWVHEHEDGVTYSQGSITWHRSKFSVFKCLNVSPYFYRTAA